ncbi:type II toxin-antitoxin system CcdA family antitoxin [Mycolicibacterium sp. XJ1904]
MPKINVYLPDDLANEVKARNISVSRIAQQALREEVERMRTIQENIPESKELLAEIRAALAWHLDSQAGFRERVAEEYPEDRRNERSARELRLLADELRSNGAYDDTPPLRKLLRLVTEYELEMEGIMPTEFNASQYRFHNANQSDDDFLGRLADALEMELVPDEALFDNNTYKSDGSPRSNWGRLSRG